MLVELRQALMKWNSTCDDRGILNRISHLDSCSQKSWVLRCTLGLFKTCQEPMASTMPRAWLILQSIFQSSPNLRFIFIGTLVFRRILRNRSSNTIPLLHLHRSYLVRIHAIRFCSICHLAYALIAFETVWKRIVSYEKMGARFQRWSFRGSLTMRRCDLVWAYSSIYS